MYWHPLPMTEHVWALSLWVTGICKNKLFCIIFAFFKGTKNREPISEQKLKNCDNLWMVTIFAHFTNYFFSYRPAVENLSQIAKNQCLWFILADGRFFFICNMLRFHPKSLSTALNDRKCYSNNYEQNQEIAKNCEFSRLSYFLQIIVFQ